MLLPLVMVKFPVDPVVAVSPAFSSFTTAPEIADPPESFLTVPLILIVWAIHADSATMPIKNDFVTFIKYPSLIKIIKSPHQ